MIDIRDDRSIYLQTQNTSYWMHVNQYQHLEHLYYGPYIETQKVDALRVPHHVSFGSSVNLGQQYSLDQQRQEIAFSGKGDFREPSYQLIDQDGSFVSHLRVKDISLSDSIAYPTEFFSPRKTEQTQQCIIQLVDDYFDVSVFLYYTLYPEYDVICRHTKIINHSDQTIKIKKLMSASFDCFENDYQVLTLNGTWGKEAQIKLNQVQSGTQIHQSLTGASSSLNNPGLLVFNEDHAIGLNLIYSGNHYNSVQAHYDGSMRIMMGINPNQFEWHLKPEQSFSTPVAVLTTGQNQIEVTQQFHRFIRDCIIPIEPFEKPVTYNHWEGTFFDYDHTKLISFATKAKNCGMDLFVIDDGWFGDRNDDYRSLGDYFENQKKFPHGLKSTIQKIKDLGLKVGIWVEPEMVSEDSELFRAHPDWAIGKAHHIRAKGRNQYVLDLCNDEVVDYIVKNVSQVIDEYEVDYIKWDMNRHHSDQFSPTLKNQLEFDVRYQMGLVKALKQIFEARPHIFLEMCSSGGNRFDLGMLSVAQQIWTSDNTDAMDRLKIQEGTAIFYPLTSISNHVSGKVNAQTLRNTPLSTRFNVACFGGFGYELDLNILSKAELNEIKDQIQFYKKIKEIVLKGDYRVNPMKNEHRTCWQVTYHNQGLVGLFQGINHALQPREKLRVYDLDPNKFYVLKSKSQKLFIDRYGEILKHVTSLPIHPYGMIMNQVSKYKTMEDGNYEVVASGGHLRQGIVLNDVFLGTGYHPQIRLWGDFGSTLYTIQEEQDEQ